MLTIGLFSWWINIMDLLHRTENATNLPRINNAFQLKVFLSKTSVSILNMSYLHLSLSLIGQWPPHFRDSFIFWFLLTARLRFNWQCYLWIITIIMFFRMMNIPSSLIFMRCLAWRGMGQCSCFFLLLLHPLLERWQTTQTFSFAYLYLVYLYQKQFCQQSKRDTKECLKVIHKTQEYIYWGKK